MTTPVHSPVPVPRTDALAIVERLAMPMLLFGGVLMTILALSWLFLLPRFSTVEVSGKEWKAGEMAAYRSELLAQIAAAEDVRKRGVLSIDDPQYDHLQSLRYGSPSIEGIRSGIIARARAAAGQDDAVRIELLSFDAEAKTVRLSGDVRSVGSRSMTVLAAFVDALRGLDVVADVDPPAFTRADDPAIGPHSPFAFSFTLR